VWSRSSLRCTSRNTSVLSNSDHAVVAGQCRARGRR
jgi:hypothetical protein